MRKIISALCALAIASLGLVSLAAPASGHVPQVSTTCENLTVNLTNYQTKPGSATPNHATVVVDGVSVTDADFVQSYSNTFAFGNKFVSHNYTVTVTAWDDPEGTNGWTKTYTGTSTSCANTVTPIAPAAHNMTCDGVVPVNGSISVTLVEGVTYTVAWHALTVNSFSNLPAGSYTVTASPSSSAYVLAGANSSGNVEFTITVVTAGNCLPVLIAVHPEPVTFSAPTCTEGSHIMLPTTPGVKYIINDDSSITATPLPGYEFVDFGGLQSNTVGPFGSGQLPGPKDCSITLPSKPEPVVGVTHSTDTKCDAKTITATTVTTTTDWVLVNDQWVKGEPKVTQEVVIRDATLVECPPVVAPVVPPVHGTVVVSVKSAEQAVQVSRIPTGGIAAGDGSTSLAMTGANPLYPLGAAAILLALGIGLMAFKRCSGI